MRDSMQRSTYETIFVDGKWIAPASSEVTELVSPTTGEVYGTVPAGSIEDMDTAVRAARMAFDDGKWSNTTLDDRLEILRRLRQLFVENAEDLATTITTEMGCPITQSRTIQAANPVRVIDASLDIAADFPWRALRRSGSANALVTRSPVGVVAAVSPWNMPLSINVQKLVPALIAGCTMVLKPSPETPLDAYLLAEMATEAGLPPGVLNVVPAGREASAYLVGHPMVDKVTFTGSPAAGRSIAARCGEDLRRVTLELGGKSAAVVLPDADLDAAVEALRMGSFRNSGQVCSLKTRILVHQSQQEEFTDRLVDMVSAMPVGDPMDPDTQIGPMVTERQRTIVEGYIAAGRAEGARCVLGGGRPAHLDRGWFVEPTVFVDATPDMKIVREEIFGPVVSVLSYRDEAHAIELANDSDYGLNGAVFTGDAQRGLRVAERIHTGTVEVNGNPAGFSAPMGGIKLSGLGRENGPEGLEAYVELKAVGVSAEVADALVAADPSLAMP
ncbi:aldehyde dehydrogenase [Rhodococcus sp. 05-2254-5]|nr:aldehyde dehydrogenase [Rhodococcus sp. 06-418-1B]OZE32116.1 aldehyde dehydrogenase [Rhodococcus sp. 05-2254-5]OZE59539.1 aldehyde dehydrogenase [Rhodococcus sp. 05-2254-1]OZE85942.1 aldehyde dehydrogenase [Rhodococcus sp. 15-649-1-2]